MRKYLFIATAVAALSAPLAASADETKVCKNVTKEQVSALFDRWNAALQTKNPDEVVKNYAPDAVLLPTVSNKSRTNHAEIKDYFAHFVEKSPKGVINSRTIHVGCNEAYDVGTYTFILTDFSRQSQRGRRPLQLPLRTARRQMADHPPSFLGDAREGGSHALGQAQGG